MKKANINSTPATLRQKAEKQLIRKFATEILPSSEADIQKLMYELEVHQVELEMQNEELQQANAMTEKALEKFSDLYNFTPTGYFTLEPDGTICELNLSGARILGKGRSELLKSNFRLFVTQDALPGINAFLQNVFESGIKQSCEVRITVNHMPSLFVLLEGIAKKNEDKCLISAVDISEHKQAEKALLESELHFRTLADSGQALIWTSGIDKKCNYFNQPWLRFTGRSLEQEMGNGWAKGVHPDDLQQCFDIYVGAFDRREKFSMEYRVRNVSGEYRWILDDGTPRYDSNGEFIGYIGHCLDINNRKLVETDLKTAKEQAEKNQILYELLVDSIPDTSIQLFDKELRYQVSGGKEYEKNNIDKSLMQGRTLRQVYPKDVADLFEPIYQKALEGEETVFEMNYGSFTYLQQTIPIKNAAGEAFAAMQISTNITGQKQAEKTILTAHEQLLLAQQSAGAGFWDWDMASDTLVWSPELFKLFGLDPSVDVASFDLWLRIMHPDDTESAGVKLQEAIQNHIRLENEYRIVLPSGEKRWIEALGDTTYDEDGAPVRMAGICLDINERKLSEENLLKNKALLTEAEKLGKIGGWEFNVETLAQTWTDETFHILEIDTSHGAPKVPEGLDFFTPEFRPIAAQAIGRAIEFGEPYDQEWELITTKGNRRWVHSVAKVNRENDKIASISGSFQDITEHKHAEETIKEKVKELERFNYLMTGRENRMIELKQEINDLCLALNLPDRYTAPKKVKEEIFITHKKRERPAFP